MLLNSYQIQQERIIKNALSRNYKESSYNLRIGKIVDHTGKVFDSIELPPQGLVTVISEEQLEVPDKILLMATVKNGLSQKGVLALNIGLVDSGWKGPINSTIINFGKSTFILKKGDVFLRLTAHKYDEVPEILRQPIDAIYKPEQYLNKTILDIKAYLGEKFLSLDSTSKEIKENVLTSLWDDVKKLASILGFIGVLGLLIAILNFMKGKDSDKDEINTRLIKLETQLNLQHNDYDKKSTSIQDSSIIDTTIKKT